MRPAEPSLRAVPALPAGRDRPMPSGPEQALQTPAPAVSQARPTRCLSSGRPAAGAAALRSRTHAVTQTRNSLSRVRRRRHGLPTLSKQPPRRGPAARHLRSGSTTTTICGFGAFPEGTGGRSCGVARSGFPSPWMCTWLGACVLRSRLGAWPHPGVPSPLQARGPDSAPCPFLNTPRLG